MLIGGFFSVDGTLLCNQEQGKKFSLRLDFDGQYGRKIYTNNGRTASVAAMGHCRNYLYGRKILLPDYLCLSVISAVEAAGIAYDFYRVKENLEIDYQSLFSKVDSSVGMIYVIHYFSVPQPRWIVKRLQRIRDKYGILIMEDITQALFSKDQERMGFGDYIVASLRKWLPMTDGGLLAIRNDVEGSGDLPQLESAYDESVYRELLISVIRLQYGNKPQMKKDCYLEYEKRANASRYTDLRPRHMTAASEHILSHADMNALIYRRIENYNYLYERLKHISSVRILSKPLDSCGDYVPFGLTLLTENRDRLYHYLVQNNIIPEIQWTLPTDYYTPGNDALNLSQHNLMLQCDQRYGIPEMRYVANVIEEYANCEGAL